MHPYNCSVEQKASAKLPYAIKRYLSYDPVGIYVQSMQQNFAKLPALPVAFLGGKVASAQKNDGLLFACFVYRSRLCLQAHCDRSAICCFRAVHFRSHVSMTWLTAELMTSAACQVS